MTMLADLHHLSAAEFAEAIAPLQAMFDAHHSRLAARKREPFHLSSATASPSRDALDLPLDRAVAGDSIDQGVIA